ncbi:EamA family transporter [Methylomonas fluvii]|uniref:EamA family transporter n=1 Tax=Methylomonas fluvii TaxID=1854564 RepID=A0ABR9DHG1_9GAMM|nr:EamA family transporter [Methylomonas fluvii]MBD9362365.1 EamA family transporter [Methylomonas fluvii]CAD6875453.1 hypothetical protein [Methylomonas fluvii]
MWLFYAFLGPPFWALVHILDSHCVGNVFYRPWMGVITSSLATMFILLLGLCILPLVEWQFPDWHYIALALLAGGLIQLGQGFYFQALEKTEAGIVAAYGNFTPTLMPLASYYLMGDVLQPCYYLAIGVLVLASICFCLIDVSRQGNGHSIVLMLMASTAQISAILIEKFVFSHITFFMGFVTIIFGVALSGVLPLVVVPSVRKAFRCNLPKIKPLAPLILGIEIANVIALYFSQRAVDLGSPSLAAAMETTVPGYTFVLGILMFSLKHRYGNEAACYRLRTKLVLVGIMTAGIMQIV